MKYSIHGLVVFITFLIIPFVTVLAQENETTQNSTFIDDSTIRDPYESWNRGVFEFNDTLDTFILEPTSKAYNFITPSVVRLLVRNELDYIQSPVSIVNSILQGDVDVVLHTTGRFLINTTFGGLGLLDAASSFGLPPHQEDFGQTLAVWGVPDGGYYIAPILGSMTLRDLGGKITDFAFTPSTYIGDDAVFALPALSGVGIIDFRASNASLIENFKNSSSDYYTSVKTIYIQKRNSDIKNTKFNKNFKSNQSEQPEFIDFNQVE